MTDHTQEAATAAAPADETDVGPSHRWIRLRNAALEYIGIGWFLTQVAGVTGRQLGWPAQFGDYLVIALGAGFVVTLVAAFVMTRRRPAAGRRGRRGLMLAGGAGAAALLVWIVGGGMPGLRAGPAGVVSESRGLFSTSSDVDAFFVVHPQQPLVPTGIYVSPGQTVTARGEGRINIALARLVEAAAQERTGDYDWVGPQGEVDARGLPTVRQDRGEAGRQRCLVNEAFPYGALMLLIVPAEQVLPATARALAPDREIFLVGEELVARAQLGGYLVLGLNDVYLDREACDPEAWASGVDPGAFFSDNIGFFSVRLQVR